jgi:hypothetical protein
MTPHISEDTQLWHVLEQSAFGRLMRSVSTPFANAARLSRTGIAWQGLRDEWRARRVEDRMQAVGTLVIVAAVVHLGLVTARRPVGYWWLIVPGTALMFGLTTLLLSRLGKPSR